MWIDKELARQDLPEQERKALEKLQAKGMAGELRQRDLSEWRGNGKSTESLVDYLTKLTKLRARGESIKGMPPEVAKCLDEAIAILKSHQQLASMTLAFLHPELGATGLTASRPMRRLPSPC